MGLAAIGCQKKPAAPAEPGMQAMPVQTVTVRSAPVAQSSEYVATIKSRRSATLEPQVSGTADPDSRPSGDHVKAGQVMLEIEPRLQIATVEVGARHRTAEKSALRLQRRRRSSGSASSLRRASPAATLTSRRSRHLHNTKADYESAAEPRKTQEEQLAYYTIRAPFDGVVGDIPVHVGDFVAPASSPPTF